MSPGTAGGKLGMLPTMQDRYFGDVGDFGKYGLLRALSGTYPGAAPLRLGIVW